jgi:hypothetical protein
MEAHQIGAASFFLSKCIKHQHKILDSNLSQRYYRLLFNLAQQMPSNMYCIIVKFTNPLEKDYFYVTAPTAIEALHQLQTALDVPTLHRIKSVLVEVYDTTAGCFVLMPNHRTCAAFVEYVHTMT